MSSFTTTQDAACTKCRFFDDAVQPAKSDEGLCRFNPPISQPSPEAHGLWPVVGASDWCGHFSKDTATVGSAD